MDVWKYRLFETPVSLISAISLFFSCFYHLSFLCCFYYLSFLFLWSHISPDALFDHVSTNFLFVCVLLLSRLISKYSSHPSLMSTKHHLVLIIGPESDHWECLSVTNWLTNCCLVNLIDVALACEDANSKLVRLLLLVMLRLRNMLTTVCYRFGRWSFGHKIKFFSRLWAQDWSRFWRLTAGKILKLEFVQHFAADVL